MATTELIPLLDDDDDLRSEPTPDPNERSPRLRSVGPITLPDELAVRLRTARELPRNGSVPRQHVDRFPTGLAALDDLLDGGLARGRLVEIRGRASTGRFSVVLSLLATATATGETVALVDLGDQLDPQRATAAGIVTERLLWARPRHVREALSAAEILLGGSFPLVILDLGLPPVPGGRGASSSWIRLARTARRHHATIFVSAPYRVSGSAAGDVLLAHRARPSWHGHGRAPRLLTGTTGEVELEKSRGGRRPAAVGVVWTAGGLVEPLGCREPSAEGRESGAGTSVGHGHA